MDNRICLIDKNLIHKIRKKELEKDVILMYNQRWTQSAIECYKRKCICKDCPIKKILLSQKCQMKKCVLELVKVFGRPELQNKRPLI